MPARRPFISAPVFTRRELDDAVDCSLMLWGGVDYETGRFMETSDCEFLEEFFLSFEAKRLHPKSSFLINEDTLRRLIRVGKLKAMFRSSNPIDFPNGLSCMESLIRDYDDWNKGLIKLSLEDLLVDFGLKLGRSFVTSNATPTRNGNYRVPFASRILFYGFPMLPFFNFSNGLSSKMHFQCRPQDALVTFRLELLRGFLRNQPLLSTIKVPTPPASVSSSSWSRILACKWWQRRVYDIALLLHFGVSKISFGVGAGGSPLPSGLVSTLREKQVTAHSLRLTSRCY